MIEPSARGVDLPDEDERGDAFSELDLDAAPEGRVYSDRFGFPQWFGWSGDP